MIIEDIDYRLTQINENSLLWDLELLHTIKPKGKESRQEFKISGYGLTLESAMKKVVAYRIHNRHLDSAMQMKDFIQELNNEVKNLKETWKI